MPRYGEVNEAYMGSWFQRSEPGGPMWAISMMKYRERADYADGRETTLSGLEADNIYAPHEPLAAVGSRIILIAPVVHQIVGDGTRWDRVAVVHYRNRMAMIEMTSNPDFAEAWEQAEVHKDAGTEFNMVMASFPIDGEPVPPQESAASDERLLLAQIVADPGAPDLADGIASTRIGRFQIEGQIMGDQRSWGEARYDLIGPDVAADLAGRPYEEDATRYVIIADPSLYEPATDDLARSLSDTSQVLF